jgi:predicted short-subunit dehydrogenase-like oxidoreductase (DUF2520 family)
MPILKSPAENPKLETQRKGGNRGLNDNRRTGIQWTDCGKLKIPPLTLFPCVSKIYVSKDVSTMHLVSSRCMSSRHHKATITLIGAGNLAQAIGPALRTAGYKIDVVAGRSAAQSRRRSAALAKKLGAKAIALEDAVPDSAIVWVCHTDDALANTAKWLAHKPGWNNKIVFHSSGALTSDVLAPLKRVGAAIASLHPMMTFVPGTKPKMQDVPFAVEGDARAVAMARKIVKDLGGEIFKIQKKAKPLYHALGSFSSPLLVATLVTAERVGRAAGLSAIQTRKVMGPILRQTLKNYQEGGAAAAFSGPIKRGDLNTVRRHLEELRRVPGASEVYRALVKSALLDLPSAHKEELIQIVEKPLQHRGKE